MKMKRNFLTILACALLVMCSSVSSYGTDPKWEEDYVTTPRGTYVKVYVVTNELSAAEISKINGEQQKAYPNAIRMANSSLRYNCHSYAWYSQSSSNNNRWMDDPKSYWIDGSYQEATCHQFGITSFSPPAKDVKLYYDGGKVSDGAGGSVSGDHSAISTGDWWVISKWGKGPLMKHKIRECPYSYNGIENGEYYYNCYVANATVTKPAAATSLQATTLSSSSIKVTWRDNSSNESGFYIWRWNSYWSLAAQVSANTTSYTDTGLTAGTTYYYIVKPYNSAGETDPGYNVSARTSSSAVTKPAAATNLQAAALSSSSIKVTWRDNSSNESGFYIYRWNSQWTLAAQVSANTTGYTDTGLAAGTTYYYTVQPYNSAGATEAGYNVSARTSSSAVTKPAAATNLQAAALSSSSIKVTWRDNSSNESGFYIYRWNSQWSFAGLASANTTSYTDTGLAAGTTYYYTVQSYNSAGATEAGYNVSARTSSSSSGGYTKPYILKNGCTFTLYTNGGTSTVTSSSSGSSTSTLQSNGIQIIIKNCVITSNPQNVPVYGQ